MHTFYDLNNEEICMQSKRISTKGRSILGVGFYRAFYDRNQFFVRAEKSPRISSSTYRWCKIKNVFCSYFNTILVRSRD